MGQIVCLIAALVSSLAVCACGSRARTESPPQDVQLAVAVQPLSAPIYVAHEQGFFRRHGLNIRLLSFATGREALDAVLAGDADYATAAETPLAEAIRRGDSPSIVGTICTGANYHQIIARSDLNISGMGDLRGRRVGVPLGTTAGFFLHAQLITSGIDPDEIAVEDLPPRDLVERFSRGELDAICAWVPHTTHVLEALKDGVKVIPPKGDYPITWNLATRGEGLGQAPDSLLRLLRALLQAEQFIAEHPDDSVAITARAIGVSPAELRKDWEHYEFGVSLDQALIICLENQARWLGHEAGELKLTVNMLAYLDPTALNSTHPKVVRIPGLRR